MRFSDSEIILKILTPINRNIYLGDMLPLFVLSSDAPGAIMPALAGPLLLDRSAYQLLPPLIDRSNPRVPMKNKYV